MKQRAIRERHCASRVLRSMMVFSALQDEVRRENLATHCDGILRLKEEAIIDRCWCLHLVPVIRDSQHPHAPYPDRIKDSRGEKIGLRLHERLRHPIYVSTPRDVPWYLWQFASFKP